MRDVKERRLLLPAFLWDFANRVPFLNPSPKGRANVPCGFGFRDAAQCHPEVMG
jgi:hypothetical protein